VLTGQDYQAFSRFLETTCGIVLGEGKAYLVRSRLQPVLREAGLASLGELMEAARRPDAGPLRERIVDAMTTNETLWFRDRHPYEILARHILPELGTTDRRLRIWSAGCSTGEEPYSIAITVLEARGEGAGVEVLATDISASALARAEAGVYDERSLDRGVDPERRRRFFRRREDGRWQVTDAVRRLVRFQPQNLKDSYLLLGRFDVIFCRNVLIYFSPGLKADILDRMAEALRPRGYLVAGAAESPSGYSGRFEMVRAGPGIVYRRVD